MARNLNISIVIGLLKSVVALKLDIEVEWNVSIIGHYACDLVHGNVGMRTSYRPCVNRCNIVQT